MNCRDGVRGEKWEKSTVHLTVQILIAIGTVAVSILAIWGDKIQACKVSE